MAETLIVEVVDESGAPCRAGEIGRVLTTDISNFATPIIRYEIGDYAEVGEAGACGRGLPTLNRILGRTRNHLVLSDGSRRWPFVGMKEYRKVAPVLQYQLVQTSITSLDVNLVVARPLSATEENNLGGVIVKHLGAPLELTFIYHQGQLPRGPGGKFEEFVSRIGK
jgi:phenylacetate-CoA ligase